MAETRGYFAVAKVQQIIPDPNVSGMYVAVIEPGSYLDFANPVPFSGPAGVIERGVLNSDGRISGALSRQSGLFPRATSTVLSNKASTIPHPSSQELAKPTLDLRKISSLSSSSKIASASLP